MVQVSEPEPWVSVFLKIAELYGAGSETRSNIKKQKLPATNLFLSPQQF
ncbi:MAG: hypothetical protein HY602_02845 [Parcubacteria group bacterium]|nr:hypothetical protein [Parcubacteria group bacterium]